MADGAATAKSIRALFDLTRYHLVSVERWAGWGRLTLVPKNTRFRCPRCHITTGEGRPSGWRPLRDLDIARRHIELRVQAYRVWCGTCGRRGDQKSARQRRVSGRTHFRVRGVSFCDEKILRSDGRRATPVQREDTWGSGQPPTPPPHTQDGAR